MPPTLAPCHTCGNPTASTARACPKCGDPEPHAPRTKRAEDVAEHLGATVASWLEEADAEREAEARRPEPGGGGAKVAWGLAAFVGLFFVIGLVECGSYDDDDPTSPATPSTASAGTVVGDEVRLALPSSAGDLVLATTEDSFDRLNDALVAQDSYGVGELLLSGQAFAVPSGTRAKLLDPGFFKSRVRITEGDMAGQAGWLAREFVHAP